MSRRLPALVRAASLDDARKREVGTVMTDPLVTAPGTNVNAIVADGGAG